MYKFFVKRCIDIVFSFSVILIFLPIYLLVGLIIFLQDGGTPIFKQKRVGLNKKEFTVMKFRSMPLKTPNVGSNESDKITITPFGNFIRRTNLDELPQFINILKGDMSLVGPRPSLYSQKELIKLRDNYNAYNCKPGLSGLAQVNSFDGMPDEKKAYWDGLYANDISFVNDVKIFFKTLVYITKKPPTY